jgi:predicted TIM-barrel fold metal-dependent hydrolase
MVVVDIHCHTFNADDLPVQGFITHVVGRDRAKLLRALAWALEKVTQGMASGREEIKALDRLIQAGPGHFEADEEPALDQADAEAGELLAELQAEDPVLVEDAGEEAAQDLPTVDAEGEESLFDRAEELRRYLKWVALFGKGRLALTRALLELYPDVQLFTPLLVDFQGLGSTPRTSTTQQLELQERISRLGILGHFGGRQVLPFVGFDPRWPQAVPTVQKAVESCGCVGVKMYPPMGFLPLGNTDAQPERMSPALAAEVDGRLRDLYDWCVENDVPITAHSNATNFARDTYRENSAPWHWAGVLDGWPGLHLNLGHMGWKGDGWPDQIAEMMDGPNGTGLYGDIGNHDLDGLQSTIDRLAALFSESKTARLGERLMFGTDWFMVASHHEFESFFSTVRTAYAARFPQSLDRFMGGAAISFLGFDDPDNANTRRVRARFGSLGMTPPTWLA